MSTEGYDSADASQQQPAELVMDQIYVLPEAPRDSDSLQIGAQVRNDGAVESGPFAVRFWLDGAVINELPFESINPGQKEWKELEHPALAPGTHHVAAMADYEGAVHEANKNDNLGTFDFQIVETPGVINEDEEVITVPEADMGARSNAAQEITRIITNYGAAVVELWTRYAQGLQRFGQTMEHSSASEAKFNMDTVAKAAVKKMFDSAVSTLTSLVPVPGVKQAVDVVKGTVEAYFAESARSDKAWAEHEIVVYIENVDKEIEQGRTKMRMDIEALAVPLINQFDEVSKDDPQHGDVQRDGRLVGGKGAQFVLDLREKLGTFETGMATAEDFERAISEAYAKVASKSGDVQGRLIFHMSLYRIAGGLAPTKTIGWDLETSAPGDHTRLAEALSRSLNGKKAWQVDLPKTVKLELSSDRGDDPWATGEINFTDDPAAYQITNIETSNEESYARTQLTEAWDKPSTKGYALDSDEIVAA